MYAFLSDPISPNIHENDFLYKLPNFYWASLIAQLVKNPPAMQESPV